MANNSQSVSMTVKEVVNRSRDRPLAFGGSIARGAVPEGVSQSSAVAKLDLVSRTR